MYLRIVIYFSITLFNVCVKTDNDLKKAIKETETKETEIVTEIEETEIGTEIEKESALGQGTESVHGLVLVIRKGDLDPDLVNVDEGDNSFILQCCYNLNKIKTFVVFFQTY